MKRYEIDGQTRVLTDEAAKRMGLDPADGKERNKAQQPNDVANKRTRKPKAKPESEPAPTTPPATDETTETPATTDAADETPTDAPQEKQSVLDAMNKARRTRER